MPVSASFQVDTRSIHHFLGNWKGIPIRLSVGDSLHDFLLHQPTQSDPSFSWSRRFPNSIDTVIREIVGDGDDGWFYGFAVDDPVTLLVLVVAIAAGLLAIQLAKRLRDGQNLRLARQLWSDCLERGGSPRIILNGDPVAEIEVGGRLHLTLSSSATAIVECDQARETRSLEI